MRIIYLFAAILTLTVMHPQAGRAEDLAAEAKAVLQRNCYRCHGQEGAVEGGMNYILDFNRLAQRKKIVPGQADASPIYKRIANGSMPPSDVTQRPTDADVKIIQRWIQKGAAGSKSVERPLISEAQAQQFILSDLEKIDRRSRRFIRYFSLTHLYNAGLGSDELTTYRTALAKLINSLSWHPNIRNPDPIDPEKTILRIDLRWYMWDAVLWNRILADYPFGVLDDRASSRAINVATASRMPMVRGDWFVATACRPQLYIDILQLPNNLTELERQLRIDANVNILQERVMRAGFTGSGISRNNRVLERHDSIHGYYWRTYDFDEVQQNLVERGQLLPDRKNIFAYPLGPGNLDTNFQHAGGEAIFSLPNGLQAYMLINANNIRIDKGPIQIVSDPKRPDRAVETGISCMSCHLPGILPKADQIHDYSLKNPKAYSRSDAGLIRALYPAKDKTLAQMEEDSKRYIAAVAKTGAHIGKSEPVTTVTLKYEADLDLSAAAAEAGMTPDAFQKALSESEILTRSLGALQVPGGTVHRQVWVQSFGDLVQELHRGTLFQGQQAVTNLPDNTGEVDPLESRGAQANQMVYSADGRIAIIAGADRTVRIHEVEGRRDLKRFIGHLASVWTVAMSPDGKRILSGSMDQSVKLWDINVAQPVFTLEGHDALVTAVAFLPDGEQAISAGFDGQIIVWDLTTGKEVRRFSPGVGRYLHALAVSSDGDDVFVAVDQVIQRWRIETGERIAEWKGHTDAVTCLRLTPEGDQLVSGSDDGTIRLWNTKNGESVRVFSGHTGPIKSVSWWTKPGWLLSGGADGTVRLWQTATGKELGVFRKHGQPLVGVGFTSGARQTVSGDATGSVLIWNLTKFYPAMK